MALSGECLTKEIAINIRKTFPNAEIYDIYGLTENSPRVSFLPPSQFDEFPESVGIGLTDTLIRIVDDKGDDVESGKLGHVIVKSKSIMVGYYKDPQETNKKFGMVIYGQEIWDIRTQIIIYIYWEEPMI